MALPYERATSGERAIDDIRRVLAAFGCNKFGTMTDTEKREVMVQFEHRGRMVSVKACWSGYAAAWLKEHPYKPSSHRRPQAQYEREALEQGQIAIYSILRDWIKGQVTAIECGVMSFEGAFLGQILLPNGKTLLEEVSAKNLLPPPSGKAT